MRTRARRRYDAQMRSALAFAIYLRANRKVHSLGELRAQVSACNHGLGLELSPAEERDVVAFLDREYYRFP